MDEKQRTLLVRIAAILTTLEESGGWIPRTMFYVALECDMSAVEEVEGVLVRAGYVTVSPDVYRLTDDGREAALAIKKETAA